MHADHEPVRERSVSAGGHARWVGEQLADGRLLELGEAERAGRDLARPRQMAASATAACGVRGRRHRLRQRRHRAARRADHSHREHEREHYRIGDAVLHAIAPGVYAGDGALVIRADGQGVRAAGSAVVNGKLWVGVCEVSADGSRETCRLQQGAMAVTTADVWAGGGWMRTTSDGERTVIEAPRGVPVPFPAGW